MKTLTKADLVDGLELCNITVQVALDTETGNRVKVDSRTEKVGKRQNIDPADGCDFIMGGSSCSTKNLFEIAGITEDVFYSVEFTLRNHQQAVVFIYCLPENKVHVITKLREGLADKVGRRIIAMNMQVDNARHLYHQLTN